MGYFKINSAKLVDGALSSPEAPKRWTGFLRSLMFFHSHSVRIAALILAAAIFLAGYLSHYYDNALRPEKVPKTAAWTRTSDGNVWIACRGGKSGNPCVVYSGSTGEVVLKGTFLVVGTDMGLPADKLSYDYFDGKRILLGDGRILQYVQVQSKSKSVNKSHSRRKKQA